MHSAVQIKHNDGHITHNTQRQIVYSRALITLRHERAAADRTQPAIQSVHYSRHIRRRACLIVIKNQQFTNSVDNK